VAEKTYGVGLVGYGFMGKTHTFAYKTMPFYFGGTPVPVKLACLCARRQETLDEAMGQSGFETGTTDFDEMLARDDVDIVHVCTPNNLHKEQVVKAVEAGKHVYVDKPLGASYADCKAMVDAYKVLDNPPVVQVALQNRHFPCTLKARQLVEEGFLGKVYSFRASYLHASSIDPNKPLKWKLDKSKGGGGVLYDLGSHVLDLTSLIAGPFTSVFAETHTPIAQRPHPETGELVPMETDDHAVMMLRGRDGALGTVEASKVATGSNDELTVEVHGDRGAIRFNLMDPNFLEVYDMNDPSGDMGGMRGYKRIETVGRYPKPGGAFPAPALAVGWIRAHVASVHHFLQAVAGQARPYPGLEEAAELQRLMDAAYESAEKKSWVEM
jgi:predicted dehydrogenase